MPKRLLVLAVIICLAALPGLAQSHRASVRGAVLDPTGASVPQVTLRITNEATSEFRTTVTAIDGRFTFPLLPAETYRIEIEHAGYKKYVSQTELRIGQDLWLDIALEFGSLNEEVVVTAAAVPIKRESAALGTIIDGTQAASLPLDGRNFLELSLLVPGASPAPQGSASSSRGDFALTVNGGREDAQTFLLDGVYNMDPKLNTPGVRPAVDAIREFEVLTSTYDASFGRNASGQVNVITQSGTNAFAGSLYGFARTRSMDARNYFAPANEPAPAYSRGQVGGSLGGPVVGNRTFFFADYERMQLREGITRIANVPTRAERQGDFSQSLLAPPINPFTRQPFPDARIPEQFIDPTGRAIASLYPEPNRPAPLANFVSSPTLTDVVDQFDVRIDHNFTDRLTLNTRYSFSDRRLFEPFASPGGLPGFGTDVPRRGQNLGVGLTQILNPVLVNEARFGYGRVGIAVLQENRARSLNREVGLPELSRNPRDFGLSRITVTGFSPLGDEFTSPQESGTDMFHVLDTLTWVRGAHLVKVGGDVRYVRQSAYRDVQSRGFLNFSDRYFTGNALADLLLGFPVVTGGGLLDNPQKLRSTAWSGFFTDRWRLAPNLTLTPGLRYEYIAPAVDADDRANIYDTATGQFTRAGTGSMPRGGYLPDRNNWAPRIGFAWTPGAAGATAIRGGYGIYYNQSALATGEGLYFNPPYFDFNLFVPFEGVPPVTLRDPFPQSYPISVPPSATGYQRDLKTGWTEHWSFSVQRQLGGSRVFEAAYVGSRGHDLIAARDINQPRPSTNQPYLRPNPLVDDVTLIESRGSSNYNALQLSFQQRFDRGVSLLSSYTFGKSLDDVSAFFASAGDPNFPQDSHNPRLEYARSSFDVRQRFSTSFAWQLPFETGVLSDIELQGIVTLQTGRPFTVALLPERDNSNTGRSTLGFGANDRPDVIQDPSLDARSADRWFNTVAFSMPSFGSFGNAGRNILDGPGYQNVNLGILKYLPLPGDARLQLRAEAFNLLNHTNLNLPDAFFGSPTFGRVVSADSPRRCQFGVRIIF